MWDRGVRLIVEPAALVGLTDAKGHTAPALVSDRKTNTDGAAPTQRLAA